MALLYVHHIDDNVCLFYALCNVPGYSNSLRPHVLSSGWQHRLSEHVLPSSHDVPSTIIGGSEPGEEVTDGATGTGSGETVPVGLGFNVATGATGIGSEISGLAVLGWRVPSGFLAGAGVML